MKEILEFAKKNPDKVKKITITEIPYKHQDGCGDIVNYGTNVNTEIEFFDKLEAKCACGKAKCEIPCWTAHKNISPCACGKEKCNCWEPNSPYSSQVVPAKYTDLASLLLASGFQTNRILDGLIEYQSNGDVIITYSTTHFSNRKVTLKPDGKFYIGQ